jgi:hypothetical protein
MSRCFVVFTALAGLLAFGSMSYAQEGRGQPGRFELLVNPVGATYWTEGSDEGDEPDFGQYSVALAGTYNFHPRWAVEGEFAGAIGVEQRINFRSSPSIGDATPPSSLAYSGNAVFYPWTSNRSLAPYATGGAGALTLLEQAAFTDENQTYFTANFGGGVKWFFTPRLGIRGDYRFLWVNSEDEGPAFFGREDDRYGHRITGGVVINLVK